MPVIADTTFATTVMEWIAGSLVFVAVILSAVAIALNLRDTETDAYRELPSGDKHELSEFQKFLQAIETRNLTPEQFADKWATYLKMSCEEAIEYYKRSSHYCPHGYINEQDCLTCIQERMAHQ